MPIILESTNFTLQISNSLFANNYAKVGAGLSIEGINSIIYNSSFLYNKAEYAGAGLYFNNTQDYIDDEGLSDLDMNITFFNTQFTNNQA